MRAYQAVGFLCGAILPPVGVFPSNGAVFVAALGQINGVAVLRVPIPVTVSGMCCCECEKYFLRHPVIYGAQSI